MCTTIWYSAYSNTLYGKLVANNAMSYPMSTIVQKGPQKDTSQPLHVPDIPKLEEHVPLFTDDRNANWTTENRFW